MILTLFSRMNGNGDTAERLMVGEGVSSQLSRFVPISEALMLPVFPWRFYLQSRGRTVFPKWMPFIM